MLPPEIRRETQGGHVRRMVKRVENGLVRLDQEVWSKQRQIGTDITGPYWLFGLVEVFRGRISFLHGDQRIDPPAEFFGLFVPPYAMIQVELVQSHSYSMGLTSARPLPAELPQEPVVFKPRSRQCPDTLEAMADFVRQSSDFVIVSRAKAPSPLSQRVKRAIDQTYRTAKPLGQIARELRVSPASMSGYFKKDYGMPPIKYRHHLRVLEGMMRLVEGQAVKDVFQEVGFEDLGRFYKNFGMIACAPPARYRPRTRKNAKT